MGIETSSFPESVAGIASIPGDQTLTGQVKLPAQVTRTFVPRCPPAGKTFVSVGGADQTLPTGYINAKQKTTTSGRKIFANTVVSFKFSPTRNRRVHVSDLLLQIIPTENHDINSAIGRGSLTRCAGRPAAL